MSDTVTDATMSLRDAVLLGENTQDKETAETILIKHTPDSMHDAELLRTLLHSFHSRVLRSKDIIAIVGSN